MKNLFLVLLLLVKLFAGGAQTTDPDPTSYNYVPGSVLHLGWGLSLSNVSQPKPPCIIFTPTPLEPGASGYFGAFLVTNSRSLNAVLNIDTKADASFLTYKANGSFNIAASYTENRHNISLVITSSAEYGRIGWSTDWTYTAAARALLRDTKKFTETYGDRVVLVERRGASISAILTLENLSDEEVIDITTSGHFSGDIAIVNASMDLKVRNYLKRVANRGNLSVQVFFTGAVGISTTEDLIRSLATKEDAIEEMKKALSNLAKSMTSSTSDPIGFAVAPFPLLDYHGGIDWEVEDEIKLKELVTIFRKYSYYLENIDGILSKTNILYLGFSDNELKQLPLLKTKLTTLLQSVANFHSQVSKKRLKSGNVNTASLKISDNLLTEIDLLSTPPKTYRLVYVDNKATKLLETKSILDGDNEPANLLKRAQAFYPNASSAKVAIIIEGYKLQSYQVKWKNEQGKLENVSLNKINSNKTVIFESEFFANLTYRPFKGSGHGSGDIILQLTDKVGRNTLVNLWHFTWINYGSKAFYTYSKVAYDL